MWSRFAAFPPIQSFPLILFQSHNVPNAKIPPFEIIIYFHILILSSQSSSNRRTSSIAGYLILVLIQELIKMRFHTSDPISTIGLSRLPLLPVLHSVGCATIIFLLLLLVLLYLSNRCVASLSGRGRQGDRGDILDTCICAAQHRTSNPVPRFSSTGVRCAF